MRVLLPILALFVAALSGAPEGSAPAGYDKQCDDIENNARMAGVLYNRGRQAEAFAALEASRQSFRNAKRLMPGEPQAYLSLASALLNANHFDEAVPLWKAASKRTKDEEVKAWLKGRLRWTKYGKVSMKRDSVYAGGQGNLTEALVLMNKQLKLYPESPVLLHDRSTANTMVSDLHGSSASTEAAEGFLSAQEAAFRAWQQGVLQRGRGGPACNSTDAAAGLVYNWPAHHSQGPKEWGAMVSLEPVALATGTGAVSNDERSSVVYGPGSVFRDHGAYVARFEQVGLAGNDGVIVDEARCAIFLSSAGRVVSLPQNLQMLEIWGDPPMPDGHGAKHSWYNYHRGRLPNHGAVASPEEVSKVASVVGFASTSYFHLVTEVVGRLWLLKESGVLKDAEVRLVAPVDPRKGKGIWSNVLQLLAAQLMEERRVIWWQHQGPTAFPDVRLRAQSLYYAGWIPPAVLGSDGGHCGTPRGVLRGIRKALLAGLASGLMHETPMGEAVETSPTADTVVFIKRPGQGMRSKLVGEAALRQGIVKAASERQPAFSVKDFDGKLSPGKTILLFARARAVVGVHGGGLTNMLFCTKAADLFEVGFSSAFAGHYRHLAAALGLHAMLLPLVANDRGIGANEVILANVSLAVAVVRARLLEGNRNHHISTDEL